MRMSLISRPDWRYGDYLRCDTPGNGGYKHIQSAWECEYAFFKMADAKVEGGSRLGPEVIKYKNDAGTEVTSGAKWEGVTDKALVMQPEDCYPKECFFPKGCFVEGPGTSPDAGKAEPTKGYTLYFNPGDDKCRDPATCGSRESDAKKYASICVHKSTTSPPTDAPTAAPTDGRTPAPTEAMLFYWA